MISYKVMAYSADLKGKEKWQLRKEKSKGNKSKEELITAYWTEALIALSVVKEVHMGSDSLCRTKKTNEIQTGNGNPTIFKEEMTHVTSH